MFFILKYLRCIIFIWLYEFLRIQAMPLYPSVYGAVNFFFGHNAKCPVTYGKVRGNVFTKIADSYIVSRFGDFNSVRPKENKVGLIAFLKNKFVFKFIQNFMPSYAAINAILESDLDYLCHLSINKFPSTRFILLF